ncbi:MAG TPA: TonB-dependent siderophore receptor [Thermoanaerobaculia bacterium]|nr:TonB-dependent siderophore receptor [Thermoanaerobaculia bacterium]
MRILATVALLLGSLGAAAQETAGSIASCRPDLAAPRVVVSGKVADATGAPLVGVSVALQCGKFRVDGRTSGDGSYRLTAPAGPYRIEVDAPGFEPAMESLQLTQSQTRDFTLQPGSFSSIITVEEPGGFSAASSTTATKTNAPLIEIPQSVSVVTQDQMTARNVQTINEAIRYTGSVDVDTYGNETRFDWINIRGFDQSTYGLFRDNSRWQSGNVSGQIDPYMIQEVDIVKGPSSVLYGQNTPGGLVNLVTKRPPSRPLHEVTVSYGSFHREQVSLDFGGPVSAGSAWRYRITALLRQSDSQVDHVPDDRWFIAPGITWTSDRTTWTFLADYQNDDTGWSMFLPSQGTFRPNPNGAIPRETFVGEPGYDYFHRDQWSAGSLFEHRLNETWTLRNTLRYSSIEYDGKDVFGGGLQDDLKTLNRFAFGNTFDLSLFTMDTNAMMQVRSGNVSHSILAGVDYSNSETDVVSGFAFAAPVDIYHPVYGSPVPDLFIYSDTHQPLSLLGVYVQDHIRIGSRWVATVAGRHDWIDMTTEQHVGNTKIDQSPNELTGRFGLTYLSASGVAPYLSYSTSFLPVSGTTFAGKPFEPTTGKQIEGGVKFQPKGSNAFVTASFFRIDQENVSVPDPDNPFSSVQQGEIRSRGFELEAIGNLVTTLNFHASYSYLDQEITRTTDPASLGKRPPLAPDSLFSLGGEYTVGSGPLAGVGFGAGIRYVGSRAGDSANTIEVPSYTLFDASVRYLWRNVEFQISGTNITDKTYVAVCTSPNYCNYGSARKVLTTVRYHF